MILRCTQKLLKELRIKPQEPAEPDEVASWHANLLNIERRKCVLFTHDITLFSLFVPGLKRPDFEHIYHVFGQALFRMLRLFDFSQGQIERMLDWAREISYTKTNNRSVLGSMNDMAFAIEYRVSIAEGLQNVDLDALHHSINETPFKAVNHDYPIVRLRDLLSTQGTE